jgi:hypothetical protein
MTVIDKDWQPTCIKEEVVKSGIWVYDGTVPYNLQIIRALYDFTSRDVAKYQAVIDDWAMDDLPVVNLDGETFFCRINKGNANVSNTQTFSSCAEAEKLAESFGTIQWNK